MRLFAAFTFNCSNKNTRHEQLQSRLSQQRGGAVSRRRLWNANAPATTVVRFLCHAGAVLAPSCHVT